MSSSLAILEPSRLGISHSVINPNGLEIDPDLSKEEFENSVLRPLTELTDTMEASARWWWGDALSYSENQYGEKYVEAMKNSHLDYSSLANSKFVSQRIPFSRRRENLSWSHHREIAAFDNVDEQEKWLNYASNPQDGKSEPPSVSTLRKAIRMSAVTRKDKPNARAGGYDPSEALFQITSYLKNEDIEEWDRERLMLWESDLRPVAEYHARIERALK